MYVINHYPYFHFLTSNTQLTTLLQTGGGHVLTYCLWDLFEEMTQWWWIMGSMSMRNTWSWIGKYEDTIEDSAPDPLYLLRTSIYSSPAAAARPVWWPVYNQSCNTFYCRWKLAFLNFDNDLLWTFAKWAFKQVLSMFNVEVAKFRTLEIQVWLIRGFYRVIKKIGPVLTNV